MLDSNPSGINRSGFFIYKIVIEYYLMKKLVNIVLTLMLLSAASISAAADADGKFAVKGAGKRLCSNFIVAANEKTTDYYLYGGWLEGYLSSYNSFQSDNYDITPWQTTELMLAFLLQHCHSNPDTHFLSAVNSLIKTLFPIRLTKESELVSINVNNATSYYYTEIMTRAKERLKHLGFIEGNITSGYNEDDIKAFTAFQKSIGLKPTGVPDQQTLASLFLRPTNNKN
ncbi:peptidoglycan-binding domain-containing protein [Glaciecola siphonariae]|uniref:Peptidoglycan-binding domain-containing protein n=1 Tax=Glaciecola siphonariae TaxID=521012 RepID=A0ABV9LTA1_9ALTE